VRRVLLLMAVLVGACSVRVGAQDPTVAFQKNYRTVLDNADVVVLRVHYGPHETVGVHDHSDHPTVYVYLNDSGPVKFVHEPGDVVLTRPPTHTGAYRVSPGRRERHSVDNLSDTPSDYLRVELKRIPLGALKWEFRGSAPETLVQGTKVEFDEPRLRIDRVVCGAGATCELPAQGSPSVLVAFSAAELVSNERTALTFERPVAWVPSGAASKVKSSGPGALDLLRIVLLNGR